MTVAVCFKCGAIKFGAFLPCRACRKRPRRMSDFVISLTMTDHYFDKATLEQIGASIKQGRPPTLSEKDRKATEEMIRTSGLYKKLGIVEDDVEVDYEEPPPAPRRAWWKFW